MSWSDSLRPCSTHHTKPQKLKMPQPTPPQQDLDDNITSTLYFRSQIVAPFPLGYTHTKLRFFLAFWSLLSFDFLPCLGVGDYSGYCSVLATPSYLLIFVLFNKEKPFEAKKSWRRTKTVESANLSHWKWYHWLATKLPEQPELGGFRAEWNVEDFHNRRRRS